MAYEGSNQTSMNYDLVPVNSFTALTHIKDLTSSAAISSEFMLGLYNNLLDRHNRREATVFSYIQGPDIPEITQQVIGSDGHYFKLTTTKSGIDFIWHDRAKNLFLFWGPNNYRVTRALNAIWHRIFKYTDQYLMEEGGEGAEGAEGADYSVTDYSDMPPLISPDGELLY